MKKKELVGLTFNRLTVIKEIEPTYTPSGRKVFRYKCQCSCGNTTEVSGWNLTKGAVKSCGCLSIEDGYKKAKLMQKLNTKYTGEKKKLRTKAMYARAGCVDRCYNPNYDYYHAYGGRGITVCNRWRYGEDGKKPIECFIEDMGYPPTLKHSLDRIDTDGNYEPSNCCWATMKEQERHRTNNRLITYNGETKCLAEWAEDLGINYGTLQNRLGRLGWSIADAFTKPVRQRKAA